MLAGSGRERPALAAERLAPCHSELDPVSLDRLRRGAADGDGALDYLVDLLAIPGGEVDVGGRRGALDLARVPGADDRCVDAGGGERPGDRQLRHGPAALAGVALELAHDREVALKLLAAKD